MVLDTYIAVPLQPRYLRLCASLAIVVAHANPATPRTTRAAIPETAARAHPKKRRGNRAQSPSPADGGDDGGGRATRIPGDDPA